LIFCAKDLKPYTSIFFKYIVHLPVFLFLMYHA
jgi:hypothetical protein